MFYDCKCGSETLKINNQFKIKSIRMISGRMRSVRCMQGWIGHRDDAITSRCDYLWSWLFRFLSNIKKLQSTYLYILFYFKNYGSNATGAHFASVTVTEKVWCIKLLAIKKLILTKFCRFYRETFLWTRGHLFIYTFLWF